MTYRQLIIDIIQASKNHPEILNQGVIIEATDDHQYVYKYSALMADFGDFEESGTPYVIMADEIEEE